MKFVPSKTTEVVMMKDRRGRPMAVTIERKRKDSTLRRLQEIYHFRMA